MWVYVDMVGYRIYRWLNIKRESLWLFLSTNRFETDVIWGVDVYFDLAEESSINLQKTYFQ